jgi:hypothetical protein
MIENGNVNSIEVRISISFSDKIQDYFEKERYINWIRKNFRFKSAIELTENFNKTFNKFKLYIIYLTSDRLELVIK